MIYFKYKRVMHERDVSPLEKPYDAKEHEARLYKRWEDSGYFNPDNLPSRHETSFSLVLPPPNVTGVLHLGHAYEDSLQDTIIRYQRMSGKKTLWIPGTDSAAIATQARVEKNIQKEEGKSRHDLGREELVRRVSEFAKNSENTILSQIRRVGASLDWSRYAYALDEKRNRAVTTAFKNMYDTGLIYRGHRIVNWDPKGQTTISDDEIMYVEEKANFYYFKYGPFTIGTARPETKFGDKYVVMHPSDERYKEYAHGQKLTVEWINGPIEATIIKDASVDPSFGTGVMTITPWHSLVDFELAQKFNLDYEQVIDKYGKLLPIAGEEFAGMKIKDAREKIVTKLQAKGLLEKIEDYTHNIATSERTSGVIEPQIMEQWFVAVNKEFPFPHENRSIARKDETITLKQLMLRAVESGMTTIHPEQFTKVYNHWINNLRDWCISRQIWFGHRIPVWYKGDEIYCGISAPEGTGWEQEEDVLDTWFSSSLWTFSTLGWPDKTKDLESFHPTSFVSPGHEILPLWVSRMILMSTFHLGEVPFEKVMIHGLVRDKQGQKFSKSLGNGIDPIEMIDKYGADALRMGLLVGTAIGNDLKFDENKVKGYKHFANKIWNASRFVLSNTKGAQIDEKLLTEKDVLTLAAWRTILKDITEDIEKYNLHLASEKLYSYFWHTFADVLIEETKPRFQSEDISDKQSVQVLMQTLLEEQLKALHPFMPFVTEAVWEIIHGDTKENLLLIQPWTTDF